MTDGAGKAVTNINEYLAELVKEAEARSEAARVSLQDTAKWMTSGIAVAIAGVIAGTSLSSLGALGFGGRFFVAVGAVAVGYIGLGALFAAALAVIAPKDHSLRQIADGIAVSERWRREMENKLNHLLAPQKTLKEFCDYADAPKDKQGDPLAGQELVIFNMNRRVIGAQAKSLERELQFRRLKYRTFIITPFVAAASIAFSYAANPPKEERVPAMEKFVDVNTDDVSALRPSFASPSCLAAKLPVIVLAEWPSGVQDVVTVPTPGCPPVRLRLDHERLSKTQ